MDVDMMADFLASMQKQGVHVMFVDEDGIHPADERENDKEE